MTHSSIALVIVIFFAAGMVKGITGMGLPTIAMGLLGTVMPPAAAASLLIVPSFVTNVWQLLAGTGLRGLLRRLWPMLLGIVFGTVAGSSGLTAGEASWTQPALGAVLILYAAASLLAWQPLVPARLEAWLSPVVGLATGLVTGATGIFVVPAVPYLQALDLPKDELVQALGLSFTTSTMALAFGLTWNGSFELGSSAVSGLAVLPALLGMAVGGRIRGRIDLPSFRRWFLLGLLLLGLQFVMRPLA
jgi:uncharacterized membrane protein YfcA